MPVRRRHLPWLLLSLALVGLARPAAAGDDDTVVLQIGWDVNAYRFTGLFQLGLHTTETGEALTVLQAALWRNRTESFAGLLQLAPVNEANEFYGLVQLGAFNRIDREMIALGQLGLYNVVDRRWLYLGLQAGVVNRLGERARMAGIGQLGLFNQVERRMYGLFQLGAINWNEDARVGVLIQASLYNLVDDFAGLFQVGAVNHVEGEAYAAQLGVVNLARRITGVQIGLVNVARRLHGVQIGLINFARFGGLLPVAPLVNVGW